MANLGETITLLCSSACVDAAWCHRTLLKGLVELRSRRLGTCATACWPRPV